MRCHPGRIAIVMLCIAAAAGLAPQQPIYFRNNGEMSHYLGMAATLDNANVSEPGIGELEARRRLSRLAVRRRRNCGT